MARYEQTKYISKTSYEKNKTSNTSWDNVLGKEFVVCEYLRLYRIRH